MLIQEAGKTISRKNESVLRQAYNALKSVLSIVDPTLTDDEETTEDGAKNKAVKEAKGWSASDLYAAISRELKEDTPNAYIQDIFDDSVVYQVGWGGNCQQRSYTLDETGVATFGTPYEVTRKVTYVKTSDNDPAPPSPVVSSMESASVELISDSVRLVEKAVSPSGEVMLKLISPGKGSSGFYSSEVLKRAAQDRIFKKGMHNFIDHPTATEEANRPEGSINNLGSTLKEDAKWYDDYNGEGPGLYAPASVRPSFTNDLNTIANDIGMSIRANGRAHVENGQTIVDQITEGRSVDYVTLPGRGGKVLALAESKRQSNNGDAPMTDEERLEMTRLREAVRALTEQQRVNTADKLIEAALVQYPQLHSSTKTRLRLTLVQGLPLTESGAIDDKVLNERLKTAVDAEMQYLAQLGVGAVVGMGNASQFSNLNEADVDKLAEQVDKAIAAL